MAYVTNISPGAAPLLWSSVDEAFRQINQNFTEIQLYINDSSINPIDLTNLYTDLSPGDTETYSLGSETKRWRGLYVSSYTIIPENEENGVWLGPAQIKGIGTTVNLPENSTVGGDIESGVGVNLIIDPNKTFFKTIRIDTSNDVVAPSFNAVLNIDSGNAISLTADNTTQTITIDNAGVTDLIGSTGISVDSPTGSVTITNTGVTSIGPTTALPSGLVAGSGISVNNSTGSVTITNTGILSATGGFGIAVTRDLSDGSILISNTLPDYESFTNIVVDNDTLNQINANSFQTSLLINSGYGIILSKNTFDKRIVFEWDQRSDLIGSVFGDDSSLLIDAVNGSVVLDGTVKGDIVPDQNETYDIGSLTNRFRDLYLSGSSLWLGNAQLTAVGSAINLPAGTTIGGLDIGIPGGDLNVNIVGEDSTVIVNTSNKTVTAGGGFFGDLSGNVVGNLTGNVVGDLVGSVFADNSTILVDGFGGQIVGPINSFDNGNSIVMDPMNGVIIGGTAGAQIIGAAGAQVYIGGGTSGSTSGDVYLGNGSNNIILSSGSSLSLSVVDLDLAGGSPGQILSTDGLGSLSWIDPPIGGGGGGGFGGFKVAADDSTQRFINDGETVKFIGSNGISTASDAEGAITISGNNTFQTFSVAGQSNVVADSSSDTLTLVAGTGISITTNATTDTITVTNSSPNVVQDVFTTISVAGQTNVVADNSSDTLTLVAGTGIQITTNASTDTVTITNFSPNIVQNVFTTIAVAGQSNVVADNSSDTLTLVAGTGISITTNATTDTVTIANSGSPLSSRTTATGNTGSIANAATANVTITGFKGYLLYKIQTSAAAWVRLYTSVAARTADSSRLENEDPLPGAGVIAEIISTSAETMLITPGTIGFNDESSPNTNIELAVTNKSGGTANITVTLTIVQVEA